MREPAEGSSMSVAEIERPRGDVVVLRLNRPEKPNVIDCELIDGPWSAIAGIREAEPDGRSRGARRGDGDLVGAPRPKGERGVLPLRAFRDGSAFGLYQRNEALNSLGRQLTEPADELVVTSGPLVGGSRPVPVAPSPRT
jgi:hypothetical protein